MDISDLVYRKPKLSAIFWQVVDVIKQKVLGIKQLGEEIKHHLRV